MSLLGFVKWNRSLFFVGGGDGGGGVVDGVPVAFVVNVVAVPVVATVLSLSLFRDMHMCCPTDHHDE